MPGLQIEQIVLIHLFIGPAIAILEKFQADQFVDGRIRPGWKVNIQLGKGLFVHSTVEFSEERARPGFFQPEALLFGQVVDVADQVRLDVARIFLEHQRAPGSGGCGAPIILKDPPFEEGPIWISSVRSFFQWSQ